MDDDASRRFVHARNRAQLVQLDIGVVRQLVLNVFSGSSGDEDEDAIEAPRLSVHAETSRAGRDAGN